MEHKYTIKIKRQTGIKSTKKITSKSKSKSQEKKSKTTVETGRLNEKFIDILEKLSGILTKHGEPFRARAYQKAQETIMLINETITPANYLDLIKGKPGIGATIMEKFQEYVNTGTLSIIEREKNNPLNIFTDVYGVGPKKAKELIDKGMKTIADLRKNQDTVLNAVQKVGLRYYENLLERIPRSEIDRYQRVFKFAFDKVTKGAPASDKNAYEIVGSYRRGAESSGDIDVIITGKTDKVFKEMIDLLVAEKIILEILSRGRSKCLVIGQLPTSKARRIDFLYTSPEEYPFSVLYFTGSKIFNTVMRGRALSMNYSLNEHGLYHMSADKKKGEKVSHHFENEASIFEFLNMEYKEPRERIDGRSVKAPLEKIKTPEEIKSNSKNIKPKNVTKKMKKSEEVVPKNVVVANDASAIKESIQHFRQNGVSVLSSLSETALNQMIILSNSAYYNLEAGSTALLTDNEYDVLKEYIERKYPKNTVVRDIGAPVEKNKVTLPYQMPSMDKIKPDSGALGTWTNKYKGAYVLSCKLDGVSGMYSTESSAAKLYTRGNGKVGQDVTHLLDTLKLPLIKDCVVRGEFIMPKRVFHDKYQTQFANARNLVAGMVNRITADEKMSDLHFVAYEVIKPVLPPSEQMKFLEKAGFESVKHITKTALTNSELSEILVDWRANYTYEIDGVIVANDAVYERKSGNPDHAFAFKMVLSDQMAEVKVVDVIWNASKDGYLKPRVQIEPVKLAGVTIEYATGFNGAFIETNKIGVGAVIQLIRSGDVIPHIKEVITPAEHAKMPSVPYKWNDTHVDVILENMEDDSNVLAKNITGFFRGIEVDGLSAGNVARIIAAGFNSVPKIIHMTKADFLTIDGFKDKTATKLKEGISEKLGAASLTTIMSASNLFGRGFSDKKIEVIITEIGPGILTSVELPANKVKRIAAIKGMSAKTAEPFVDAIPKFLDFMRECGLERKLNSGAVALVQIKSEHPLYKKSIVMSGKRDKDLEARLLSIGATIGSSVSKNTFAVVSEDIESDTGKVSNAKTLGIPLFTPDGFRKKCLA
jgi:NAD-dependent DNA ligase